MNRTWGGGCQFTDRRIQGHAMLSLQVCNKLCICVLNRSTAHFSNCIWLVKFPVSLVEPVVFLNLWFAVHRWVYLLSDRHGCCAQSCRTRCYTSTVHVNVKEVQFRRNANISNLWEGHFSKHMNKGSNNQKDPILLMQTFNKPCISISFQNNINSQLLYQYTCILPSFAIVRTEPWKQEPIRTPFVLQKPWSQNVAL